MADVYSYGMLCSAAELGIDNKLLLPEQREGILILSPDTPIGKDIKEVLGLNDTVLDIDLTANKQDCFCMTGIAREAAAVLGKTMRMPDTSVKEAAGGDVHDMLRVAIEIPELCSRFTSRALKNIKIMPSPDWMQNELRACGVRPISNVVDVTNYVMMELGQPMHAYDYDTLAGQALIVRRGKAGEHLQTLDDQDRELTPDMITIADTEKAVGLGGVKRIRPKPLFWKRQLSTARRSGAPPKRWACAVKPPCVLNGVWTLPTAIARWTGRRICWKKWEPAKRSAVLRTHTRCPIIPQ